MTESKPARPDDGLEAWIAREFSGYGVAIRRKDDPPIPGEPLMSMVEAKDLTRRAVAKFAAIPSPSRDSGEGADAPVVRDAERFSRLADEPPASIPEGHIAPLDNRTTREIIHDRMQQALREAQPNHPPAPPKPAPDAVRPIGWVVCFNDERCFYWERDVAEWKAREFEDQHKTTATIDPLFSAAPVPSPDGAGVQDTYFVDQRLPIRAVSGDAEDDRVIKLHYRRKVTDQDRVRLTEVLNAGEQALALSPDPGLDKFKQDPAEYHGRGDGADGNG